MSAIPPLLAIAEGHKVRERRAPVWRPKEIELLCDVANLLQDHCLEDWRWTYINRKAKDAREGAILKRMGVKRGWGDFELISPEPRPHFLELKRSGEKIREDGQSEFRLWCVRHGVPYVVASSLDVVLATFDVWGCLRVRVAK